MKLETVRLGKSAKDKLVRLKTRTGLKHWNEVCRWAMCVSLVEPSHPAEVHEEAEEGIEMTWKVFGGNHQELYLALLKQRCKKDGIPLETREMYHALRLHLYRGIGYLFADRKLRTISDLYSRVPGLTLRS